MSGRSVREWDPPPVDAAQGDVNEFLGRLGGPAWFRVRGRDRSRTCAVVTLLHGNEPSGVRALHRLFGADLVPAVDLVVAIGSVQTALAPPGFAYRTLPGCRDLNRCFRPPFDDVEGRIAEEILERLRAARPESVLDLHNTSGSGPPYGVSTRSDPARLALTSRFARHLIVTDLRLGSLMEALEDEVPAVTIECGGARDADADVVARNGLVRYATEDAVLAEDAGAPPVEVLEHPLRLELGEGAFVAYAPEAVPGIDLTLRHDVDRLAFGRVEAGEPLGWMAENGLDRLRVRTAERFVSAAPFFGVAGGRLVSRRPLRLFMVTTNPAIALSDCLFYFIEDR